MRPAAVIDASGVVVNIIVLGAEDLHIEGHTVIVTGAARVGDTWDGTTFVPNPGRLAAEKTAWRNRAVLSSAQLAGALLVHGVLTPQEARLFGRSGQLPEAILTAIEAALSATDMTEAERHIAMLQIESATEYRRASPLVPLLGAVFDKDADALDQIWQTGEGLV